MLSALLRDLGQSTPPHIARFFADLFCNSAETFSTVSQEGLLPLPQRVTFRKLLDAANAEAVIKETHDGQKIFDRFVDTWNISNLAEEPDLISQDHLWSVLVDVIEVSDESMRLEISERIGAFVSTQVEEKFGRNFRVSREMRDEILVYDLFLTKFWAKMVSKCRENAGKI